MLNLFILLTTNSNYNNFTGTISFLAIIGKIIILLEILFFIWIIFALIETFYNIRNISKKSNMIYEMLTLIYQKQNQSNRNINNNIEENDLMDENTILKEIVNDSILSKTRKKENLSDKLYNLHNKIDDECQNIYKWLGTKAGSSFIIILIILFILTIVGLYIFSMFSQVW